MYTRCTTPRALTSVHHTVDYNLQQTAFSYTPCTDLYSSHMSDNYYCVRLCVHKLYLPGRSRSALYTRCTTPTPLMAVHPTMYNNLQLAAFSYTFCTYLYSSPKSEQNSSLKLRLHKLYLPATSRSALYTRCTTPRPLTAVHHTVDYNLQQMAFSYSCCMVRYNCPEYEPNSSLRL